MTLLSGLVIAVLLAILTLSSYISRLYAEMGKFLSGEFQENIDVWEQKIEPRLALCRECGTLAQCAGGGPGGTRRCPGHRDFQSIPTFCFLYSNYRVMGRAF